MALMQFEIVVKNTNSLHQDLYERQNYAIGMFAKVVFKLTMYHDGAHFSFY